jgi:hypothetical protein
VATATSTQNYDMTGDSNQLINDRHVLHSTLKFSDFTQVVIEKLSSE